VLISPLLQECGVPNLMPVSTKAIDHPVPVAGFNKNHSAEHRAASWKADPPLPQTLVARSLQHLCQVHPLPMSVA
jgi:hypothetical protein